MSARPDRLDNTLRAYGESLACAISHLTSKQLLNFAQSLHCSHCLRFSRYSAPQLAEMGRFNTPRHSPWKQAQYREQRKLPLARIEPLLCCFDEPILFGPIQCAVVNLDIADPGSIEFREDVRRSAIADEVVRVE